MKKMKLTDNVEYDGKVFKIKIIDMKKLFKLKKQVLKDIKRNKKLNEY